MADNKQQFTLQFNADTSKAKKQIADLFKSLDNVQKFNLDNFNISPDLVKASHAAEELSGHLRAATNVNTGQLDLSKFNQSIRNSNSSLTDLISNLAQGGSAGQAAFEQMTHAIARTQVPLRQTNALVKEMATTLKNTIKWELSSTAVHGLESALSGAVNYAKNLNTSLTNIRIVTGQTVEDMARFTKEANEAAKTLSTTTKSYADASLIYYQQGDSQELAAKKAAITIKAANSSFETSAKEMSEYLTSVWNSYQVGADELERYVDIMANLGAKTATSLEEIATSMQKVAATSNTVGVSMEQVSSIIATVSSVTRESAESIGTSYKTIFARIGDLKLGKTDEDGIGLGQVSSQLESIGVQILDESGNLREMGSIITDLGTKWQTMNQAQKTAVAQVVAGKRQYTQLMALFENWDMYQQNMNIAENSDGALQSMADIYAESWEAASARVQASMEGIFNSLINDQGLIKLTNFTADFVDGIGSAIDSIGGLNGVLRLTGSILMKTFSKEAGARIKDLGHSFIGAFQDPKKNYQEASKQIRGQLADVNNKQQVDAQIQLIDAKNKLLEVEEYLSATQKQVAQASIADIENQVNKVKELEDAYTDLQNNIVNVNLNRLGAAQSSNSQMGTLAETFKDFYAKDISDDLFKSVNLEADKSLQSVYNALSRSSQMAGMGNQSLVAISPENLAQYDNLEQKMSVVRQEAEGLRSMMKELGITIQDMPIERLNQMLEKTDWSDEDIQALRNALEQLEQTGVQNCANLERVINSFLEEASQAGFVAEDIERLRQVFQKASAAGDDLANAQRKIAAASESLSQKTNKLNHSLDKQSMSFEKAVESALDLGSGALDLLNGFSAMSDVTAQWGDESVSLADKLGSLLSTVLNLGMAIPSLSKGLAALFPALAGGPAGWIALAAAAGAGVLGAVAGNYEADKKEYQDKQNKANTNRQEEVQKADEELSNIQTLMKNYNTLRETYLTTGEGQDALAASARALAEAYGLVGANVLIAEGNFKQFESLIARSSGLDVLSDFYQTKIHESKTALNDQSWKSIYYDEGNLKNANNLSDYQYDELGNIVHISGRYVKSSYDQGERSFSDRQFDSYEFDPESIIGDYHLETIQALEEQLTQESEMFQDYTNLSTWTQQAKEQSVGNAWVDKFTTSLGSHKRDGKDNKIQLNAETWKDTIETELTEYFDPEKYDLFQGTYEDDEPIVHLRAKLEDMLQANEEAGLGSAVLLESQLDDLLSAAKKVKIEWLKQFSEWGKEQVAEMESTILDDTTTSMDYKAALKEREDALKNAKEEQKLMYIEDAYQEYSEFMGENVDYNYFETLTNEQGLISYNDEGVDKAAWYQNYLKQKEAAHAEKTKIEDKLKSVEAGSLLETFYKTRLDILTSMVADLDELEDKDLTQMVKNIQIYEESAAKVKLINEAMADLIGKSEANTGFDAFSDTMDKIKSGIDASAKSYEELQKYLIVDETSATGYAMNEDGTYQIKENLQDSYNAVRDQIAAGFISDFTSFDDYLSIYQNIAAVFSGDQFTSAMSYIDAQEIKNSREVDTKLLNAMQRDLQSGEIGTTANKVLEFNRTTLAGEKAVADYQTMSSLASSYKEDLNLTDAQGLLSVLQTELEDGTSAWNDFIKMDFDQRQAYLQAREKSALKAAQEAQKQIAEDAKIQQESLYATKDLYEQEKIDWETFIANNERQKDGTYKNKETEQVLNKEDSEYWDAISTKLTDYATYGLEIDEANAIVAAIDLMLTQTAGLSEQMQTLAVDFEQFNKTGRVSADVMKKMAEWGIDGSKIKTAQDYLKVMKSIYTQAKTNANTAEQNYLAMVGNNEYDWSNEQVQKDHAEEYTAWQEMMRLKQIEYDTEEQYNTTRQGYLDSELAKNQQILSQMKERKSLAEEEANKTQQLAEAMTAAIQTGNLSESAQIGMDQELLDTWNNAADATTRGAAAAQAWGKYAIQVSTAGEEIATAYESAKNILDNLITNRESLNISDLYNFNFSDATNGKQDFSDWISQVVSDPAAQAIWNEAFDELIKSTDISNMSDIDIVKAVKAQIDEIVSSTDEEFQHTLAKIKDSIVDMYSTLGEQEASLAQQVVNEWESAFRQIADLRRSIIMGEDIGSDLTNSLSDYVKYANAYQGQGTLAEAYKNGTLKSEEISLGTGQELTEKLLASMGLQNDTNENNYYDLFELVNGKTALKSLDDLAAEFGINKEDAQFKDKDGNFDSNLYEKSVKNAVAPFLKTLLENSGLDSNTVEAKLQEFLNGSITAEQTINEAANKMLGLADEYAALLDSNQKLSEADAKFKATQEEQKEIQTKAQKYAEATESIMQLEPQDKTAANIADILSQAGISSDDYIASMQEKNFGVESLQDIANLSNESLGRYEDYLQQDALKAGQTIVDAANEFKAIVTKDEAEGGLGFKEGSVAAEVANEYVEEATNAQDSSVDAYVADDYSDMSTSIDTSLQNAESQLSTLQSLDSVKQGTTEWAQGIDNLYSAYANLEGADEIISKLADGTIDLSEANDQLVDFTLKATDNVYDFSDAQWDLYKKTLRSNDVVVDGYESLEDYFKAIEDGRKVSKKWISEGKKFNKELKEQEKNLDENKDGMLDYSEAAEIVQDEWENLFKDGLIDEKTFEDGKRIMGEGVQGVLDEANRIIDAHPEYDFTEGLRQAVLNYSGESAQCLADLAIMMGASADECLALAAENSVTALQDLIVDMLGQGTLNWGNIPQLVAQINAWMAANGIAGKRLTSPSGGSRGGGGGGSRRPSGGGGGSGGGGEKQKEKKELLRYEDEVERYHEQEEVLDRVSEKLDAIDKLKSRTYGKKHLAQLNAETEALKEQLEAQADLYNEANKWRASDQKELMSLGVGVQFDEDGNISNYEEVMKALIDKQNANIERYNNSDQEEGDKLQLEADEQWYEDAVQAIEDYEEALRTGNEALIEMEEIRNQISALELEKITYKLEIETELNENDLDILDYYVDKWEDDLGKQSDRFAAVTDSIGLYQNNLANLETALAELNEQHQNGTINEADYAEGMQDIQEQILENLQNLEDAGDQLKEIYSDALDLAREEIDKTTEAMQHSSDVMESYISIMGLMGRANDFADMQAFYDAQYTYGIQQVGVLKAHYDTLISARAEYDAKVEAGQELTEVEQANYDALQEQIRETEDQMLSATEATLEALKAGYENTVNAMSKDLEEFMVGSGNSIAGLADQYAYFQEKQDRYVSTAKELFEVSKLNRDIENSLADATTDASKEALKALQDKINKQSELNELTEYDIQMNQLEYQLLLARIQLEEASSSKDTVRLTRDENGNYAYQYTADQDKVDEAMQQYEDVLQKINELSVERTGEIEQQMIDAMQNNLAKFNEIMTDETLSTEERNQKIADLNTQFSETMLYLQEQAGIAGENLTWNQEMIAEHFGVSLSDITASTAGNVNDSVQAMIDRADEFAAKMNAVLTGDGEGSVQGVWEAYKNKLEEVSNVSGLNYDTMTNKISTFTTANELAAGSANRVLETLQDTLTPLTALTAAWGVHAGTIENMVEYYEALAEAMNATMRDAADSGSENSPGTGGTPASTQFEDKGYGPYEVTMPDGTKVTHNASGPWGALAMAGVPYSQIANVSVIPKFIKGGLVDFTGLAQLDGSQTDPELVLNADDTRNMLDAVKVVRQLDATTLSLLVTTLETSVNSMMAFMGSSYHASGISSGMQSQTLDQNVQITAEFPNVTSSNEIEEAFNSLVNRAAQFAQIK